MTDQFATINGNRLRYRRSGTGPLVVFGHGLLGSIEQVEAHRDAFGRLEDAVSLLRYDTRGHAQSEGPGDPAAYTWETLGRDMTAFAANENEPQTIFGGVSMSAAAALWVALEQPDNCRALFLLMPPPLGGHDIHGDDEKQAIQMLRLIADAIQGFGIEQTLAMAQAMPGFDVTAEEVKQQIAFLEQQNAETLPHIIRGLIDAPYHEPEDYARINVPVLVLAHEGDPIHPVRSAKLIEQYVPHARVRVGDAPYYWLHHQDEFVAEARDFLSQLG